MTWRETFEMYKPGQLMMFHNCMAIVSHWAGVADVIWIQNLHRDHQTTLSLDQICKWHPADKNEVLSQLLLEIRIGYQSEIWWSLHHLRAWEYDWPELDIIEKSLREFECVP